MCTLNGVIYQKLMRLIPDLSVLDAQDKRVCMNITEPLVLVFSVLYREKNHLRLLVSWDDHRLPPVWLRHAEIEIDVMLESHRAYAIPIEDKKCAKSIHHIFDVKRKSDWTLNFWLSTFLNVDDKVDEVCKTHPIK
jgi:hypothetical protein